MTDSSHPDSALQAASWHFEHLDPRARWGMRLGALVGFGLLALGGLLLVGLPVVTWLGIDVSAASVGAALLLALAGAVLLALAYAGARWRGTRYALTPQGLRIQRGVWWRSDTLVPRSRVQHTDLHRGPLDRRLGLAGLRVYTAGSELGKIALDGLPFERAVALRDALIRVDDDAV